VHSLVLSFIVALVLHMRSARCSIAWFPGIVPVGFFLAEVRPLTLSLKLLAHYLNDFVLIILKEDALLVKTYFISYIEVINVVRAPRRNNKDNQRIQVKVLSYLLYIKELTISLLLKKVQKAIALTLSALAKTLLLLADLRTLARFFT
jgi:hypothetical protein